MESVFVKDRWFELLISENELIEGIDRISIKINEDFKDKEPIFIGVLNGSFVFASELIQRFNTPCEVTFTRLKSYEGMTKGSEIKKINDLVENITNRHVVIIEDIIESGGTIQYILDFLKKKCPLSIRIATLFLKPNSLLFDIKPTYVVRKISNNFIVGFGLDYNGYGRNYRNVYQLID